MKKLAAVSILCLVPVWITSPAHAVETKEPVKSLYPGLSLRVGLEYEEGDYGTGDTTETWTLPVNVRYRTGNISYEITVPYISAESSGEIIVRSGGSHHTTSTSGMAAPQSESGIGDVRLAASYFMPQGTDKDLYLFFTGRLGLDTGDENRGLGTGETSYAFEFSVDKYISDNLYFGTVGYEFVNDAGGVDYEDVLYGLMGMLYSLDRQSSVGGSLYYSQASAPGFDDIVELNVLFRHRLDVQNILYGYVLLGLSDSAADWGMGINIRHYF